MALRTASRTVANRSLEPTAAIVDSQSVKTTDPKRKQALRAQRSGSCPSLSGGPRGYDGGKKIKGRKRQLAVDLEGLPIVVQLEAAKDGFFGSVQDRGSAPGPEESDLRNPRTAGEGSNGREAVCRWWLCRSETSGEVREVRSLRSARDRGQTQGKAGLYRAISSLGGGPEAPAKPSLYPPRGDPAVLTVHRRVG